MANVIRVGSALLTVMAGPLTCQSPMARPVSPRYSIIVTLGHTAPRLHGEAVVHMARPDTGRVSFILAELFHLESVELFDGRVFRPARTDSTYVIGQRPGWGNVRWSIRGADTSAPARPRGGVVTFRVRYRVDTAAAGFVFGIDEVITFASGINTAWYPQIEDGVSALPRRVRTKRGTGSLRFQVPHGIVVYSVGAPLHAEGANVFHVGSPAHFNFAAARYEVRHAAPPSGRGPPTATYFLARRDSAASYAAQSLTVLHALQAEFGPYPFDRFALVEIPASLAERAGFAGASADGAIFITNEYLDQPFNPAYYGHEIGHQWWGVTIRPVGPRGTWILSEGMAQYGALRAIEALRGPSFAKAFREHEYPGYFGQGGELYFRTVAAGHDAPLADLPGGEEWARDIANSKGFMAMNALANEMGQERLRAAFRDVLAYFRDRRLSWADFEAAVTRAAGRDMRWFFAEWFERTGAPELLVERMDSAQLVRVRQPRDFYHLAVDLGISGPGCALRIRVALRSSDERVTLPGVCRADSVVVDPDYQILRWTPALRDRFGKRD